MSYAITVDRFYQRNGSGNGNVQEQDFRINLYSCIYEAPGAKSRFFMHDGNDSDGDLESQSLAGDYVRTLLEHLDDLEKSAESMQDQEISEMVNKTRTDVLTILVFLLAFRKAPHRLISEPGGVAEQMNISRDTVYWLLHTIGFDPAHFVSAVEENLGPQDMIQSSPIVGPIATKIMACSGNYLLMRDSMESE